MLRRERIFARLREGWAYADIAQAEGLSSKRIGQIVSKALQKRSPDSAADHAMLQLARLEPALRLAAGALADGDVAAISPYLKLLDRLDRYQRPLAAVPVYDDKARERLLAKMNRIVARLDAKHARRAAKAAAMDAARLPAVSIGRPAESSMMISSRVAGPWSAQLARPPKKQFGFRHKSLKSCDSGKTFAWILLSRALLRLSRALTECSRIWILGLAGSPPAPAGGHGVRKRVHCAWRRVE